MRWVPYTTQCDGCHIPHNPMDAIYRGMNVIHYHVTRMWSSYNLFLFCRRFVVDMDIKNRQSRDTGNIRYTRHRTKEKNHQHPEEQHEPHLKSGMNPCGTGKQFLPLIINPLFYSNSHVVFDTTIRRQTQIM